MSSVAISGDIIGSTTLTADNKDKIREALWFLKKLIETSCRGSYVRLSKGDYLECYLPEAKQGLRIALLIKCFLKSLDIKQKTEQLRFKYFSTYAVRLVVGIGEMTKVDPEQDILDGEAIYLSGRLLDKFHTADKDKIFVKNTLCLASANPEWQEEFEGVFALLDILLSKLTSRQCKVVFYKLQGMDDAEIACKLDKKRNTISEHSTLAGWNAIEAIVCRFENVVQ